ncbi:transporter family-2 protein [Desulfohalotomaculum tongense]|uniref:DMT family transporter n=1 Tax=Desulforadius tongensis TaxID=1216062 RepID=UPI00195C0039|nr:DMT family transporter [Desulforadius tongensis]MBM7855198.1 transporter family-2 protein [Desulforadius tongensis]
MGGRALALVIAALSGMTMALQGTLNSALGKIIGMWETTLIVHVVGTIVVAVMVFVFKMGVFDWTKWLSGPWYTYLGGVLSIIITYTVVRSIPKVGVASATTAIIIGQVFTAGLIDHLGLFDMERIPFTWHRVLGALLMAGGAWLILFKK